MGSKDRDGEQRKHTAETTRIQVAHQAALIELRGAALAAIALAASPRPTTAAYPTRKQINKKRRVIFIESSVSKTCDEASRRASAR